MAGEEESLIRGLFLRLATVTLAVLLSLAVVEVGLRIAGYDPLGRRSSGRYRFIRPSTNPDLRYELVPGARGLAWRQPVAINSHGFRDQEYTLEKPPGTFRIIVIGDSITFAGNLEAGQRFTEVLEARLLAERRSVEVLNLGVGGYDTLDEVAFLEHVGIAFDPDLVVLAFCINDLGIHSANLRTLQLLERYGGLIRSLRLAQLVTVRVDRASLVREIESMNREEVFRSAYAGKIAAVADDPVIQDFVRALNRELTKAVDRRPSPFLAWYTSQAKIGRLRWAFEHLRALADTHDFDVLVLVIPHLKEEGFTGAYRLAYGIVEHEARRTDFVVVNLYEPLRRVGLERLRYTEGGVPDPLHLNEEGHRLIASKLYDALHEYW